MSIPTRSQIISGPGTITIDGKTIHDQSGIEAAIETTAAPILTSLWGLLDAFKADQIGTITFTPAGEITSDILGVLYPYANPSIGSSIFGTTDTPCIIHSKAGTKLTLTAAALTQMPSLLLSPLRTAFGQAGLTFLVGSGLAPSATNALYKVESTPFPAATLSNTIKSGLYLGTYNSTTIRPQDGWEVTFDPEFEPITIDDAGTVDMILTGVTTRAICTPVGLTESAYLTLQAAHTLNIGTPMASGQDLTIATTTPGALTVTLKNAIATSGPMRWGSGILRAGQIGFESYRSISGSTPGALFTVGIVENSE